MTEDTRIIPLHQSEDFDDALTTIARDGAQRMLAAALVAKADAFESTKKRGAIALRQERCHDF